MDLIFEVLTARDLPVAWRPLVCRMLAGIRSELTPEQRLIFELVDVNDNNGELRVLWSYPHDDLTQDQTCAIDSHIVLAEETVEIAMLEKASAGAEDGNQGPLRGTLTSQNITC